MAANKLTLSIFMEFIEIRTKIASQIPLFIAILWTLKRYNTLNMINTLVFIVAVLLFDMATTAINNTVDYYKAIDTQYKQQENVIGKFGLNFKQMVMITFALLSSSILFALILVFTVDAMILLFGAVCMIIGIGYTFGPFPLSRLPLGEVFSGVTMGFGIFFLAVYVNHADALIFSSWLQGTVVVTFHWLNTIEVFLHSVPLICLIANIMLANNICDLEQDIANQRRTLVYFIGKKRALLLYNILAVIPWFMWLIWIMLGYYPIAFALVFIGVPLYWKVVQRFNREQIKAKTFVVSLKCFVLYSAIWCMALIIQLIVQK